MDKLMDGLVAPMKAEAPGTAEYGRTTHFADIDGDGHRDAIVFFTLEGVNHTNTYLQYMTVFLGEPRGFRKPDTVAVGGKLNADVSTESPVIRNGKIILDLKEFVLEKDATCCPSRSVREIYAIQAGKLMSEGRQPIPRKGGRR